MKILIRKPAFEFIRSQNFNPTHEEKYLYFLSLLSQKNEFRNLSSTLLQRCLGKNKHSNGLTYKTIITNLIEEGIIQCDNKAIQGRKSKGYKITSVYFSGSRVQYEMKNTRMVNKIEIALIKKFEVLPEHIRQMKTNLAELTFNGRPIENKNVTRSRTGRVFNYLTSTKRAERRGLLWKASENLVEFDLAAAQPYFLGLMVAAGMGYKSIDECLPDDLRMYLELTSLGSIYKYFADKLGLDITDSVAKDKFKKKFYNTYFFNTKYAVVENSPIGLIFKSEFPTIHKFVLDRFISTKKTLSFNLQAIESTLIINTVYKALYDQGIWSATIHDAIICKASDAKDVSAIFTSIINQNISPCLISRKDWIGDVHTFEKNTLGQQIVKTEEGEAGDSTIYIVPSQQGVDSPDKNKIKSLETIKKIEEAITQLQNDKKPVNAYAIHKMKGISRRIVTRHLEQILKTA